MINKLVKLFAVILMFAQVGMFCVSAKSSETVNVVSNPTKSESFVKKLVFGNGFEYVIKIKYYPEVSTTDELGNKIYKRTVTTSGEFFDTRKNKKPDKIIYYKMKMTFTYDKKGDVWISCPEYDILYSKRTFGEKKWKIIHNHEIFTSPSQCIVSGLFTIYKNPNMARHAVYLDNAHLDIICRPDGSISFNAKSN